MSCLSSQVVPRHVAIIMDGNGRWAKTKGCSRLEGHRAGIDAAKSIIESAAQHEVDYLTLFAFGIDNWRRPSEEVANLISLFSLYLSQEAQPLHENNIRLRVLGNLAPFQPELIERIKFAEALTAKNTGLTLILAVNYSGRWDLTETMRRIASDVTAGRLSPEGIDESTIAANLSFSDMPDPDLFIRTSGELRLSNFFLWQLSYTELYFSHVLWPDFTPKEFEHALESYGKRQRRYGFTQEQLEAEHA